MPRTATSRPALRELPWRSASNSSMFRSARSIGARRLAFSLASNSAQSRKSDTNRYSRIIARTVAPLPPRISGGDFVGHRNAYPRRYRVPTQSRPGSEHRHSRRVQSHPTHPPLGGSSCGTAKIMIRIAQRRACRRVPNFRFLAVLSFRQPLARTPGDHVGVSSQGGQVLRTMRNVCGHSDGFEQPNGHRGARPGVLADLVEGCIHDSRDPN